MKLFVLIILGICQGASLDGLPFGYKDNYLWITCSTEERDCNQPDKLNSTDAYCLNRVLYDIADVQDLEYAAAKKIDDKLDGSYLNKMISRCVNEKDKDAYLAMNMVRDIETGILASYEYLPTLNATQSEAKRIKEQMYILEENVPQFYSRYLQYGFSKKFKHIELVRPDYEVNIWFGGFKFSPFDRDNFLTRRDLLHYYISCVICFILSYLVEYMNQRRYNWQAKALRDHNPLIHRKGLQSLTIQQQEIDSSLEVQKRNDDKKMKN